ncbi:MAG: hypothetical protein JXM70_12145 [Pirellulales bacterium]|nr:hypothetical protein [Pirellulales bacterium]
MPTVIKATDRNAGIHGVAYNFTDMAVEADRRLGQFHDQAVAIVEKAKQDARQIEQQAKAAGLRAAAEEINKQLLQNLATLMPALRKTIQDIQHSKQAWLAHWEKSSVHLATAIAERLIRKHLPESPELTLTLVREALELAAGSARIRVHLNPADHKTLGRQVESIAKELSGLAPTELVPDERISAGGVRVETEFGIIDQQFESQLARIEEELT